MLKDGENIADAFRSRCDVEVKRGSSTVMNDVALSTFAANAIEDVLGSESVVTKVSSALMGSDDFANYAERVPGLYFFLHTNNPEKELIVSNHNPKFDIDESVLWKDVAAYCAIAMKYLA